MSKIRFVLIVCFIFCLFSCWDRQCKIELPITQTSQIINSNNYSTFGSQGSVHIIRIYIDNEFSKSQEASINRAFKAWSSASYNYIKFEHIYRHNKPGRLEDYFWHKQYDNSIFIWNANINSMSKEFDYNTSGFTGFWDIHGNVVIYTDRINWEGYNLYNVALHEIGHMLGLKHIEYEKSVMQPKTMDIASCITSDDAYRLCLIYGCVPNPECN